MFIFLDFQGNDYFGQGFWYEAVHSYTKSLDICPLIYTYDRLLYFASLWFQLLSINDKY